MSTPRQFLVCTDAAHAEVCDQLVMEHLRETQGARGNSWSGIYTDGTRYGILWGAEPDAIFDPDEADIATEEIDENGASNWSQWTPPQPPPESP